MIIFIFVSTLIMILHIFAIFFVSFLVSRIGRHYDTNNMDSKNLARCWWPTLIRMDFQSYGELTYNSRIPLEILQTLIEQSGFFFHGENQV